MRWDCMTNLESHPGNLEALHGALAKTLADKITSGEATAAGMAVARQFLKDHGVDGGLPLFRPPFALPAFTARPARRKQNRRLWQLADTGKAKNQNVHSDPGRLLGQNVQHVRTSSAVFGETRTALANSPIGGCATLSRSPRRLDRIRSAAGR